MKSKREITNDGTELWINENNEVHREDGPAAIYPNGLTLWKINGILHREDGPAMISKTKEMWYKNGKKHREDGPARIDHITNEKTWYKNDKIHNEDGPAYISHKGMTLWWLNDESLSFEKWCEILNKTDEEIVILKLKFKIRKSIIK